MPDVTLAGWDTCSRCQATFRTGAAWLNRMHDLDKPYEGRRYRALCPFCLRTVVHAEAPEWRRRQEFMTHLEHHRPIVDPSCAFCAAEMAA